MSFNKTKLLRPYFSLRYKSLMKPKGDVETLQRDILHRLITAGRRTVWGREHGYDRIGRYEDFVESVSVTPYTDIRSYVMRMIDGERNVLWPGLTRRFAQSSGTSDGKSKFIPITDDSLRLNHYKGGAAVVATYLANHPESDLMSGKSFILGGSFDNQLNLPKGKVMVGDLSANLIDAILPLAELVRVPKKSIATMANWTEKLPALVEATMRADVRSISGVPSWFLIVLRSILEAAGATEIHQVWPHLEVFFHGGIAFGPYRQQYNAIINPKKMNYMETYNASEGFFALQDDPDCRYMRLLPNVGIFYELKPIDGCEPIPMWEAEVGRIYELIISGVNGLWRYPLGDTVMVRSIDPFRITIAGRTKHYINAFGEEVMVHNTDAAITHACAECGCHVANYTVAPVYTAERTRGHHQWLIEFSTPPTDLERFADVLDHALANENSDYEAKRAGDIFLGRLTVTPARQGLFNDWLASTGKLGGQRKVPRLSNDREIIESILKLN